METCIETLHESRLTTLLTSVTGGKMAATWLGLVVWNDGKALRTFVKCFPKGRELGIVNEITGYIIAKACDLPIPSRAGIMRMPEPFMKAHPQLAPVAFVVTEAPGKAPLSYFGFENEPPVEKLGPVLELIANWARLHETLAFDDWTANQDRHLGNIVVENQNSIYLIDHSNLPVDINWQASQLDPYAQFDSRLMQILKIDQNAKLPEKVSIARAAEGHGAAYDSAAGELNYWWDRLLGSDESRRLALENFIEARAKAGNDRVSKNLQLLALGQ